MPAFFGEIARGFWATLAEMSPYLLLGFLVAGFLSVLVPPEVVERHLGGRGLWPIVKSSLFGVPLPLCSCGVIPVAASLRRHGASKGATTAFLLSTPQTGVDSILVTYSLLGPVIAVLRPVAAFVSGIIGGAVVSLTGAKDEERELRPTCEGACCVARPWRGRIARALEYGFVTLPRDIAKALVVGIIVAALISAAVPKDYFAGVFGTGIVGMLVMMALGIPVYVCATASVPVAAALMYKGVSPGAAVVFLMTGPATNAASLATIWKVMGKRTAITYLGTVAGTSLGSGILLDYVFKASGASAHFHAEHGGGVFKTAAALVLLGVLGAALWNGRKAAGKEEPIRDMDTILSIGGMHCSHCVATVERALGECAGVEKVKVDLATGKAAISGKNLDREALAAKVMGLGYTVEDEAGAKEGTHGDAKAS